MEEPPQVVPAKCSSRHCDDLVTIPTQQSWEQSQYSDIAMRSRHNTDSSVMRTVILFMNYLAQSLVARGAGQPGRQRFFVYIVGHQVTKAREVYDAHTTRQLLNAVYQVLFKEEGGISQFTTACHPTETLQ